MDALPPETCENPRCDQPAGHWDHKHDGTFTFRGWLCRGCNQAIGMTRESRDVLLGLIEYLDRTSV